MVTVPVLLAGMLALAGITLGQVYSGPLLALLVAGAAAGSALIGIATRPLPAWAVAPLSVLGLLGYGSFAIIYSARQSGVVGDFADVALDAVANGVPRLLTAMLPVEAQPDTVAVPVIVTWLAGLAATELGTRSQRMMSALVPPLLLYVSALYLVGPHRSTTIWTGLGFAGLGALALAATGQWQRTAVRDPGGALDTGVRRALRIRAAIAAATGVAVIVALAAIAASPISGGVGKQPADPRAYVTPPQLDTLDENPLSRISGWAVTPDQHLLDTTLNEPARIRLAVLGDYDGITWRVGGLYHPAGRSLPSPPPPPAAVPVEGEETTGIDPGVTTEIEQRITVVELGGKLLPAVGTPRRVDGVRVSLDPTSGTLILPEGLSEGLSYTVTSQRTTPDINVLPTADVPKGPAMARYLSFAPNVPSALENAAQQLASENAGAYQRAAAIEQFLAEHYRLDPKAPSGHAYRNLEFFLFGPAHAGGRRGTSEQFAASFALLARMVGLPSRVVVGFNGAKGSAAVHASDAYAWPEVLFAGIGWVPFDPLPRPDQQVEPLEPQFEPKPEPTKPEPSDVPAPTVQPGSAGPTAPVESTGAAVVTGSVLPVVGAGAGGGLLLLLAGALAIILIGRKALRRRRLDEGSPADRVTGAWLEVTDALRLAGSRPGSSLSAAEIAQHAQEAAAAPLGGKHVRLPAPPLTELASQVNAVTFAAGGSVQVDADAATGRATAFIDELKARRPWWRRLIWAVHPGPLRWQRRRDRETPKPEL
ncbi:DUF3488 and transglutaminase-like domain-containing protein [Allocatelliglobosispora scoriae]|uniref:DUF3488 and transglutaminase-like domain-containing protein n=1 Tax=Allocatelliglobosispora scoriae TaxID=643052 RepID=UPI0028AB2E7B|nr:transglutaminaseTgpA domain-containing protein [Allocatelliglobosispora scoriae]